MLKEITMFEFQDFAQDHPLASFYQTPNYAIFKSEDDFDYDYLGYYENNQLVAATLMIYKNITFTSKYAYAPRGFLMDYQNLNLLQNFTKELKKYLKKKKIVFLKIDPLLIMRKYDPTTKALTYQEATNYKNIFEELGYKKLKDNLYFESSLPRFDGYIDLKKYEFSNLNKNTRNKINNSIKKGLELIQGTREDLEIIYKFLEKQNNFNFKHYNDLYKAFASDNLMDLFLVKVDYEQFMANAKNAYEKELEKNNIYNEKLKQNPTEKNLRQKMLSDKLLVTYKNEIMAASSKYTDNELQEYIAGALVIKTKDTATIVYSGYEKRYRHLNANYFLHNALINYYKDNYDYLDLNGLAGDFTPNNPYHGLNEFKLGFKPLFYEYIGELDLIINDKAYNNLLLTGKLHQIFDKKA